MLQRDPRIIIRNVASTDYLASNTTLTATPAFHTGWYNYGSTDPQVTFTNIEEGTAEGGDTGLSGGTGDGRSVQKRAGTVTVNCWAGTREDMEGMGPGGGDLNPKSASYQMAREVARVLNANSGGTTNPDSGEQELLSLSADAGRSVVDTDAESAVYRQEVIARYTYVEEHE